VGAINLFPGRLERIDDLTLSIAAGPLGEIEISKPPNDLAIGAAVTLAIRPEQVRLTTDLAGRVPRGMQGRVATATYLGDRTYVSVVVDGVTTPILACLSGLSDAAPFYQGRPVGVEFSREISVVAD
jgi:ABC-type Fe3+/spermidine/putrescine transport system ATPase subunit